MQIPPGVLYNSWSTAAARHLARTTAANRADTTVVNAITDLIDGLIFDGLWGKIAQLCVVQVDEESSLLNLKGNTLDPDSTKTGVGAFTSKLQFEGTTSTGDYVSTGLSEDTISNVTTSSMHVMAYVQTAHVNFCKIIDFTNTYISDSATNMQMFVRGASPTSTGGAVAGFGGVTTIDTTAAHGANNDNTISVGSYSPLALSSAIAKVAVNSYGNVPRPISAWGCGAGMTLAELQTYENRIKDYMTAIGAAVYP